MAKWVYLFKEGDAGMRNLLGGKGANLAEMTNLGLPIPQGFTVTTEACTDYYESGERISHEVEEQIMAALVFLEGLQGKKFGDTEDPLLVSVRSGARASHAWYDGYHPESGSERCISGRLCKEDRQSEICV